MRSAVALSAVDQPLWGGAEPHDLVEATPLTGPAVDRPVHHQAPLPFPRVAPVLPAPVERDDIGPLRHRCARFMQALVEVLSGERAPRQMAPWMDSAVYGSLTRRLLMASRTHGPASRGARLVSVHVSMVDDEIAEVAARMVHRGRSRAIAVRLEPRQTHRGERIWCCTALEWA